MPVDPSLASLLNPEDLENLEIASEPTDDLEADDENEEADDESRYGSWNDSFHIDNAVEAHLVRQLTWDKALIDQLRDEEEFLVRSESFRAQHHWDESRRHDAVTLGVRLARNPELIANRLRQSKHGADWLINRWNQLADVLKKGETWTDKQRKLALDLTGAPPDFRDPANLVLDPAALAAREIKSLNALRNGPLSLLDDQAREYAIHGVPLEPSRALQAVRRRHAALKRFFYATMKLLRYIPPAPAAPPAPPTPPAPQFYTPSRPSLSPPNYIPTPIPPRPLETPVQRPLTPQPTPTPTPLNRRARRAAESAARRKG